jgi:Protein phosphatase inhibitor
MREWISARVRVRSVLVFTLVSKSTVCFTSRFSCFFLPECCIFHKQRSFDDSSSSDSDSTYSSHEEEDSSRNPSIPAKDKRDVSNNVSDDEDVRDRVAPSAAMKKRMQSSKQAKLNDSAIPPSLDDDCKHCNYIKELEKRSS